LLEESKFYQRTALVTYLAMKVILSGSTGFIGGEVLNQALIHPSITSLICITRRALPESITVNPKVQTVIISDFANYSDQVLAQLQGAEACIWAMGSPAHKNPDLAASRKIEIDYTLAAASAFSRLPALKDGKSFRFVYLSGLGANRDINKTLWFLKNVRNIKGEVENGLLEVQGKEDSNLEVTIVRPGGVLAKGSQVPDIMVTATLSIRVEELAAAMINEVVSGVKNTRTLENNSLRNEGRKLVKDGK